MTPTPTSPQNVKEVVRNYQGSNSAAEDLADWDLPAS